MRYLPFALSLGSEFKQVIRSAAADPRCSATCAVCAGRMPIAPERDRQTVRCPRCWRRQEVRTIEEPPWRLSASAAVALQQTRRWARG